MAYQKQTWRCGEVVTADKLNHMEDGIASASDTGFTCLENYTTTVIISDPSEGVVLFEGQQLVGSNIAVGINDGEWVDSSYDADTMSWSWQYDGVNFQIIDGFPNTLFKASQSGEYKVFLPWGGLMSSCLFNNVMEMASMNSQGGSASEQVVYIDVTNGSVNTQGLSDIPIHISDGKIVALREYESSGLSTQYKVYYYCQCERPSVTQAVTGHIFSNGYKTVRVDSATGAVTEITN